MLAVAEVAAPAPEPLDYTIQGEHQQVVRIRLKPGQEVFAEAGRMLYKFPEVRLESRTNGDSAGSGVTHFRASSFSEVGFAGAYPGRVQAFDLRSGQSLLVQRDGFLCAQSTARLSIELVKKLGAGFFGGKGFILDRLTGPGTVFIHAGGDSLEFILNPRQIIQVDAGCIVAFDDSVGCDTELAGGIETASSDGEGLFLATLTGPGRVVIQSRREISPLRNRAAERDPVPVGNAILGSND
jgi:uncharacterized protein (AIM24 family)